VASGCGLMRETYGIVDCRSHLSTLIGLTCSAVCCSVSAHHTISAGDTRCREGRAVCAESSASNAANTYWATARAIRFECRTKSAILRSGAHVTDTLIAVFKDGAFRPESPVDLPEGTRVVLSIKNASSVAAPEVKSVEERRRIRREVVERMMRNPLPPDAPRFKRSDMNDRD